MHFAPLVSAFLFALSKKSSQLRTNFLYLAQSSLNDVDIAPVSDNKYETLLDWLARKDAEISDKIKIKHSERGGGYGAFLTAPVEPDELLFTLPRGACITLADATNDKQCG